MKKTFNHNSFNIKKLKEKLMQDSNIIFAIIFGSYAKSCQHSKSDLDLALFFKNPLQGLDLFDFINELSEYTKKDIDLVVLNNASAFLRHQVMKHKILLFTHDQIIYRQFREKTMTDYDIYKFVSGMNKYDDE
ncbi:Polymerase beta nucleotidyltransferase domain-containing protein [Candidatus Magnetomoraceae bacterium gMMP-15]